MQILHLNTQDKGGAFQAAYRLHQGLKEENIESNFLVLYQYTNLPNVLSFLKNQQFLSKIKNSINYRRHQRKITHLTHNKPKAQFNLASSPYHLHQHPLVKQADVINLHWTANFLDYTSFFKKIDKPIVWTLHDEYPFSGVFHYQGYQVHDYQELDLKVRKEKLEALSGFKDLHIVAPSKWLHEEAKQSTLFKRFPNYHIPYGLDTSIFKSYNQREARSFFGLPEDKKVILFVADSLEDKRKGFVYILEALKEIKKDDIFLATLGGGKVENVALPFKNLGFLSNPIEIAQAYSAADIFVIPSLEDNLPNTVLEAMACGTPVVGFDTGGIPDMVRNSQTGFTAQFKNSKDLAQKITQVLEDDELRGAMSQQSRAIIQKEYSLEIQAKAYIEIYQEIIKNK